MATLLSRIYDAITNNRNELFRIHLTHKKWGKEWYELVEMKNYDDAKMILISRAKGNALIDALDCINELAQLEAQIKVLERWN